MEHIYEPKHDSPCSLREKGITRGDPGGERGLPCVPPAPSLSLRRPPRRREGGGTSGLSVWRVRGRARVVGDAAEVVAVASRPNKFLRAPFAVRRGLCLRLGASGVGDPRISSRSRAMGAGGPSAPAGWVLRWAMVPWRRRLVFLLVGMICCCCSSSSSALMLEGDLGMPGRMARPR
jgi:hypothetical protein